MIRYWPICHLKIKLIPTFLCRYNIFYGNISDLRLATFCASRLFLPFARQTRPYDTSANFWAFDTCPAWDEVHDNHKKSACSPWGEALLVWGSQARWHWGWTPTCQKVIIVCSLIVKVLVVVKIIILIKSFFFHYTRSLSSSTTWSPTCPSTPTSFPQYRSRPGTPPSMPGWSPAPVGRPGFRRRRSFEYFGRQHFLRFQKKYFQGKYIEAITSCLSLSSSCSCSPVSLQQNVQTDSKFVTHFWAWILGGQKFAHKRLNHNICRATNIFRTNLITNKYTTHPIRTTLHPLILHITL